jgi:outer membrane protein assembly factor BamE (lipoprotein component of BamABCDE complex)
MRICFLPLVLVVGCVSPRETLDSGLTRQIRAGQTRAEVAQLLGKPNWTAHNANRKSVDVYVYYELVFSTHSASDAARDLKARTFSVRYDPEERAEETMTYESLSPAAVSRISTIAGRAVTADDLKKIQIGATTRAELEATLGPPIVAHLNPVGAFEMHWFQVLAGATVTHPSDSKELVVVVDDKGIVCRADFADTAERR